MPDWTIDDILCGTKGTLVREGSSALNGFSIDTRTLQPGEVFFAIKGENFDGHQFIPQAIAAQASVIVASHFPDDALKADVGLIRVCDPLAALQDAAGWHRTRHKAQFVGVTGSNGKTTTKEMLLHLFSAEKITWATSGNFNNHIGLPLSLLRMPLETEAAIIEMGMNHAGEIRFLTEIARPSVAIVTNIGPAHIGFLGSLENIALAKAEILENLGEESFAILPGDDPFFPVLKTKTSARIISYGENPTNTLSGEISRFHTAGIDIEVAFNNEKKLMKLRLLGKHNAINSLGALAVFFALGGKFSDGLSRMEKFMPVKARMEAHEVDGVRVILDCYNANPTSMDKAIEYLDLCDGRRVAVLGDMRELGEQEEFLHRKLGEKVAKSTVDIVVAVGTASRKISEEAINRGMDPKRVFSCGDTLEAAEVLSGIIFTGDTVLLKASRGMHFEAIVKKLWPSLPCELH